MNQTMRTQLLIPNLGAVLLLVTAIAQPLTLAAAPVQAPSQAAAPKPDLQRVVQSLDRGEVTAAVQQVEKNWQAQYEAYWQGKLTGSQRSVADMQQILRRLDRQTNQQSAVIYAIPTPQHLELILVTANAAPVHRRVAVSRQQLQAGVEDFRLEIVNPDSARSEYLPPAQQLYQWLIAPLQPQLKTQKTTTLIFCLGAGLRSVPLAALHDGNQFLVEQYNLAVIPAFGLLDIQRSALRQAQVLAMGASQFNDLAPLPAVPLELAAITAKNRQGKTLLNQDFTLANLQQQRRQYAFPIVHLATHAEFVAGTADKSYIQFWDEPLRLTQIRALGLQRPDVQLLVLSACRTALGDPQAELGFAGFAVQSGAKATLASLWAVSDVGTLVLMTEFYQHLATANIKTEALRQTQISMLHSRLKLRNSLAVRSRQFPRLPPELTQFSDTDLAHPYYWAGFTMIGNPW